MVKSKILLHKI